MSLAAASELAAGIYRTCLGSSTIELFERYRKYRDKSCTQISSDKEIQLLRLLCTWRIEPHQLATLTLMTPESLYCKALLICSAIEVSLFGLLGNRKLGMLLLKDCLMSPLLPDAIPGGSVTVSLCCFIFLPDGLNLRNLLW